MIKPKPFMLAMLLISALISSAIPMFTTTSAALPYTEITGKLNGASYLIQIPYPIENWNRNLVVYCHGFSHTEPQPPLSSAGLAAPIIAGGYAFAMSSYGMGGYFISTAANNTYLLTQYVKNLYNVTGKIFLIGISQGGGISLQLAEKYPNLYSGVLDLSGSKDLKMSYNTRIDFLSAKNDSAIASKLQALGASVPPYPFPTLQVFQSFNTQQVDDLLNATGGTPTTAPKAYEDISADYHANISVPVITVHSKGDPVNTYAQAIAYQAEVNAAGNSNFYRLYATDGTGHVDATVTSQIAQRFQELVAWSNAINQDWTQVTNARATKAYPDLKETIWQKNPAMPPPGQYDKIALHRLSKTNSPSKGVVFLISGPIVSGELQFSNPPNDTFTKTEANYQGYYLAQRGYDVYGMDWRPHFVPAMINGNYTDASQLAFMSNWGWDQLISDMKEAVEKVKEVSGASKVFMIAYSSGAQTALNYATLYQSDIRGLIIQDGVLYNTAGLPMAAKRGGETGTYNLTKQLETMNKYGNWSEEFIGPMAVLGLRMADQNPGLPAWNNVTNQPLNPPVNPLTGKAWANITDYWSFIIQYYRICNLSGGYSNASTSIHVLGDHDRFTPARLKLESQAMADYVNCPYVKFDFDDNYAKINVPTLVFASGLYSNSSGKFKFVNGIATDDFTGIMLPNYMQMDMYEGNYMSRDVSEPMLQWMQSHYQPPAATTFSSTTLFAGQTWYFCVHSNGGINPHQYQWYEGNSPIAGQTSMILAATKSAAGTYTYHCKVTDAEGATTNSSPVALTVR